MGQVRIAGGCSVLACCSAFLLFPGPLVGGVAPEVEWAQVLFPTSAFHEGFDGPLKETSDGGFIVSGSTLKKTDARGGVVWEMSFEFPMYQGPSVRQTRDGGYILGGTFYAPSHGAPSIATSQDVALIKVDPEGTVQWQRAFGEEGEDAGFAVQETGDGGYVVLGHRAGSLHVLKADGGGNLIWERTYQDPPATGYSIQETRKGGLIVAGQHNGRERGAYLLKVDGGGNRIWDKVLVEGGLSLDIPSAVRETGDGGFLLAGTAYGPPGGGVEGYVRRTDGEGNVLWNRGFPGPAGLCWLKSMDLTSDGGAVATGFVQVLSPEVVGVGEVDVYLVRVDPAGELLWEKRIETPGLYDVGVSVVQTRDGGYAACSHTHQDASLIKLAPEGAVRVPHFRRGDVDGSGLVQVTDPIALIGGLFLGEAPLACEDAADADDDGKANITDVVLLLFRLFLGGEPLPSPGSERCGEDPTADGLSCRSPGSCARGQDAP